MELTAKVHREDDAYWANIEELPGCFASGDTLDELFESLREGISLCLDESGPSPEIHVVAATLRVAGGRLPWPFGVLAGKYPPFTSAEIKAARREALPDESA